MNRILLTSLVLSLIIHLLFLSGIKDSLKASHSKPSSDFQVFLEKPKKAPSRLTKSGRHRKKISKTTKKYSSKKINYKKFSPYGYQAPPIEDFVVKDDGSMDDSPSYGSLEGDINATMNHLSLTEYTGNRLFFEILKAKFNKNIEYPQELVEHKIEGKTWIKILISHKGELIKVVDSSAKIPTLKTYAIIGVHKALENTLPRKYWYHPQRNLTLILNFDFQIYTYGNRQSRFTAKYHKNRFDFLRVQMGQALIPEFLEENARYIPPIIPMPGGFFFSFTQAYNMVKAWSEMDPRLRKRQRLEMTKEKLDMMMKKAQKRAHRL